MVVFGLSQTDVLPGVEQLPLEPPCEPLTGDSHAHLLEPLGELAAELGYTVSLDNFAGLTGGCCDSHAKRIVVESSLAMNSQVRVLVHEIVRALGVNYQTHTRPQAEVIVDTVVISPCQATSPWVVVAIRPLVRREALCRIPGVAGMNSKEGSWV